MGLPVLTFNKSPNKSVRQHRFFGNPEDGQSAGDGANLKWLVPFTWRTSDGQHGSAKLRAVEDEVKSNTIIIVQT